MKSRRSRRTLIVTAVLGVPATLLGAKVIRSYRLAQAEFHLGRWEVGPPPPELRGAEAVTIPSRDGAALRGWWVPPRGGACVVLLHGSETDRRQLLPEARLLAAEGFGVLMFDSPGLGESGGRVTWSRTEPQALLGVLDWLEQRSCRRIGALGFSMGASMLLVVAGADPRVRALVVEAAILDMEDQLIREAGIWGPIGYVPARFGKRAAGYDPSAPKPLDTVSGLRGRPLLIINGTADGVAPPSLAQRLFDAAPGPKELWMVPGAGHGGYYRAAGQEYDSRLARFFASALG